MLGNILNSQSQSGAGSFIQLADAPSAYTGFKGCVPIVNSGENGLVFGLRYFPVEQFGAVGDAKFKNDGAIAAGSNMFYASTSVPFVSGDVGKTIVIPEAGASGAQLQATITAFISTAQVQISVNASSTVSDQRFVWGTDNTTPIQNTIEAAKSILGGDVIFRSGTPYLVTGTLSLSSSLRIPILLRGDVAGPWTPYNFSTAYPFIFPTNMSTPCIRGGWNTSVQDLAFFYPTQKKNASSPDPIITPRVFPMTIGLNGAMTIQRCTFINSYDAIGCETYSGGHTSRIQYNHIGAFRRGIHLDYTYDVCYINNNHNWVFYNIFEGFWQAYTGLGQWTMDSTEACGAVIMGADQTMIHNFFVFGKYNGLSLENSPFVQQGSTFSYGEGSNLHFDLVTNGVNVKKTSSPGWRFTNVGWIPRTGSGGSLVGKLFTLHTYGGSVYCTGGTAGTSKRGLEALNVDAAGSGTRELVVSNITNLNPIGPITPPPAIPATDVGYENKYPVTCRIYVSGGTVSGIKIGGVSTGLTQGEFTLMPTETLTITYTAAPTWAWFGL